MYFPVPSISAHGIELPCSWVHLTIKRHTLSILALVPLIASDLGDLWNREQTFRIRMVLRPKFLFNLISWEALFDFWFRGAVKYKT